MNQPNINTRQKWQAGASLLVLTALLIGNEVIGKSSTANATQLSKKSSSTSTSPSMASAAAIKASEALKDGSYSATGSYDSPGGTESLKVSVTLAGGDIADATVVSGANDPTASVYQTSFISGYKTYVIGKPIESIKLSNVSGSSLTSQGFNEALKSIEQQAKA
jgi:uncharacterized protein with FMN-binding domain